MSEQKPFRLPWRKRVLRHQITQKVVATAMAYLLRLFWLTFKLNRSIHPDTQTYLQGDKPAIFCFWHGRMILLPFFMPKNREMHVLVSQHRDGELLAQMVASFGVKSVRGSTSKGALEATQELADSLQAGHNIGIAPDGPRGPIFEVQRGALHLARQSGCALIPVSFSASKYKQLRSWDKFIIPLPFSAVRLEIGAPMLIDAKAKLSELKQAKTHLQDQLNAVMQQGDGEVASA